MFYKVGSRNLHCTDVNGAPPKKGGEGSERLVFFTGEVSNNQMIWGNTGFKKKHILLAGFLSMLDTPGHAVRSKKGNEGRNTAQRSGQDILSRRHTSQDSRSLGLGRTWTRSGLT